MIERDDFVSRVLHLSRERCQREVRQAPSSEQSNCQEVYLEQTSQLENASQQEPDYRHDQVGWKAQLSSQPLPCQQTLQGELEQDGPGPIMNALTRKRRARRTGKAKDKPPRVKNILTNYATGLRRYVKARVTSDKMMLYNQHFGDRVAYKGMERWTQLFSSQFHDLCQEFFEFHALRWLVRSNVSRKAGLVKYLGIMRQAILKRELVRLEP